MADDKKTTSARPAAKATPAKAPATTTTRTEKAATTTTPARIEQVRPADTEPPAVQPVPETDAARQADRTETHEMWPATVGGKVTSDTDQYVTAKTSDGVTVRVAKDNGPAEGLRQTVADLGSRARVKRCTVGEGDNRCPYDTTPGDEICSYHAVWFTADGKRRETGPIQRPGAVDVAEGPGVVKESRDG